MRKQMLYVTKCSYYCLVISVDTGIVLHSLWYCCYKKFTALLHSLS